MCGDIIELDFKKLEQAVGFENLRKRLYELESEGCTLEDKWRSIVPELSLKIIRKSKTSKVEEILGETKIDVGGMVGEYHDRVKLGKQGWTLAHSKNISPIESLHDQSEALSSKTTCLRLGYDIFLLNQSKISNNKAIRGFKEVLGLEWLRDKQKIYE
jgi:hypothetical protein